MSFLSRHIDASTLSSMLACSLTPFFLSRIIIIIIIVVVVVVVVVIS